MHLLIPSAAAAAGNSGFLGVDWGSFVVVFLVAFAASVAIVVSYALGLRLLAVGAPLDDPDGGSGGTGGTGGTADAGGPGDARARHRPGVATAGAYVFFAIAVAAVLYGLWLLIPQFH